MSAVQLTIHAIKDNGHCSLTGKEGEVLIVTFGDGTLTEGTLSQKSLIQLLRMKLAPGTKKSKAEQTVEAIPLPNGEIVTK
jgi:hypothetical protein